MHIRSAPALTALLLATAPALAATDTATQDYTVVGTVPALCSVGTPDNNGGIFDMGVLVDTTTGLLRTDLTAPDKRLLGAFCSANSVISIVATAMLAQNAGGPAPAGFANAVNYTAMASGWTAVPASFQTGNAVNPAASQSRGSPFTGEIAVAVSGFATAGGPALRPVADNQYLGRITVTLSAAN